MKIILKNIGIIALGIIIGMIINMGLIILGGIIIAPSDNFEPMNPPAPVTKPFIKLLNYNN